MSTASELLQRFDYAHCVMLPGEQAGVLLRAACAQPVDASLLAAVDALFGVSTEDVLRYDDMRMGVGRRVRVAGERIAAVRLSGDMAAESWLKELFVSARSVAALRRMLLAPAMPAATPARGKIVCSCWNVAAADIERVLSGYPGGDALEALQRELKCGTQCGSCVPELKQLIAVRAAKTAREQAA